MLNSKRQLRSVRFEEPPLKRPGVECQTTGTPYDATRTRCLAKHNRDSSSTSDVSPPRTPPPMCLSPHKNSKSDAASTPPLLPLRSTCISVQPALSRHDVDVPPVDIKLDISVAALCANKTLVYEQFRCLGVLAHTPRNQLYSKLKGGVESMTSRTFPEVDLFRLIAVAPETLTLTYFKLCASNHSRDISIKPRCLLSTAATKEAFAQALLKMDYTELQGMAAELREKALQSTVEPPQPSSSFAVSRTVPVLLQSQALREQRDADITDPEEIKRLSEKPDMDKFESMLWGQKKLRYRKMFELKEEAKAINLEARLEVQRHLCYLPWLVELLHTELRNRRALSMEWVALAERLFSTHPRRTSLRLCDIHAQMALLVKAVPEYYQRREFHTMTPTPTEAPPKKKRKTGRPSKTVVKGPSPSSVCAPTFYSFHAKEWKGKEDHRQIMEAIRAFEAAQ